MPALYDAFSPTPKSANRVRIFARTYDREALETAWLMLAEGADRRDIATALFRLGVEYGLTSDYIGAAANWSGEVKAGQA